MGTSCVWVIYITRYIYIYAHIKSYNGRISTEFYPVSQTPKLDNLNSAIFMCSFYICIIITEI